REKLWSDALTVESMFVKEGDLMSKGRDSVPIPRLDPKVINPAFLMVSGTKKIFSKESIHYDQSLDAHKMLKGEGFVELSHISIPFPFPSDLQGAYICLDGLSSYGLSFLFTMSDGSMISRKYTPNLLSIGLRHDFNWWFFPIDLHNVVLCEIQKQNRLNPNSMEIFRIFSLVFIQSDKQKISIIDSMKKERAEEKLKQSLRKQKLLGVKTSELKQAIPSISVSPPSSRPSVPLLSRMLKPSSIESVKSTNPDKSIDGTIVRPMFVHKGYIDCFPISRNEPIVMNPSFRNIKAKDETRGKGEEKYYQSENAQNMMEGNYQDGSFTYISIPFSPAVPMKGAYICLTSSQYPPANLTFTFTKVDSEVITKKYEFPRIVGMYWYFLPIDISEVVLCEISGKGRETKFFGIASLGFIREETLKETQVRESREKLWSESSIVSTEFVKGDAKAPPIPRDDPKLIIPSIAHAKGTCDNYSKESRSYNSAFAKKMLEGKCSVALSHLSIPFTSPSSMKGAYIYVCNSLGPPFLFFTFTHSIGKKTYKKYKFSRLEYAHEWHFLPIGLDDVILCEIEGKGSWNVKNSRKFSIDSLLFIRKEHIPDHIRLSPVTTEEPSISVKEEEEPETKKEMFSKQSEKQTPPSVLKSSYHQDKEDETHTKESEKDLRKESEKESAKKIEKEEAKTKSREESKHKPKHDSITLISASTITPQCIIGSGGFGEVLLVKVDGIPFPCVLKKMLRIADETVVKGCRKEFKVQLKLFNNPKCFNRIPRPLYILDLLDCDMKGVYGFLMEFCVGGSVSAFAKRWCADGKYVSVDD
ncbi:hypothetical protein ADUPG1_010108, partial [Aduncisulcus paluster]